MITKRIRINRLRKLHDFLMVLPNSKFFFDRWIHKFENNCGTVCCAAGWMPTVDPRNWEWTWGGSNARLRRGESHNDISLDAQSYFGINVRLFNHIFMPGDQSRGISGNKRQLADHARPKTVAANMAVVIEKLKKGELEEYLA